MERRLLMDGKYAWSIDEENYHGPFVTIGEAFLDAELSGEEVAPRVWIGACYLPTAEAYVDADLVIEHITCQDEYYIDAAEDWPHATKEQLAELTRELQQTVGAWLDRHKLRERFFLVRDAKRYARVNGQVVEVKGGA